MYEAVRTGAVGILFSLPALVVLTAVAMSLLLSPQVQKLPGAVRRTVLIGVGWTALFTLLYVSFLRHGAADPYVRYSLSETFLGERHRVSTPPTSGRSPDGQDRKPSD